MKLETISRLAALLALDTVRAIVAAVEDPNLTQNAAETIHKNEAAAADIDGMDIYRRCLANFGPRYINYTPRKPRKN